LGYCEQQDLRWNGSGVRGADTWTIPLCVFHC
jgi:hypothetical protein